MNAQAVSFFESWLQFSYLSWLLEYNWRIIYKILPYVLEIPKAKTATDMDGTLHTDLWKSETSREIKKLSYVSSFEDLQKLYWFSKLEGRGS